MNLIKFGMLLLVAASLTRSTLADEKVITPPKDIELVLDLWPQENVGGQIADNKPSPKIAVRNLGFQVITSKQSMQVLEDGTLHLSRPDGTESSYSLGSWYGRGTSDIGCGELAHHANGTPIEVAFTIDKPGRYLVWWTSEQMRSNALVFDKDPEGLHRRP